MATILIVDDEAPIRQLLASVFEEAGYRSLQAHNGRQALDIVERDSPDVVLTDVMMPVLGGTELCRHLKSLPATNSIPVILMSAAGREIAEGCGANAFLDKPFQLDEVETLVYDMLLKRPGVA
jgi:CheY-like chemotaxis protein